MAGRRPTVMNDPAVPLEILRRMGNWDHRKLGLFAVACCRRVWHLMTEQDSRDLVLMVEQAVEELTRKGRPKAQEALQAAGERADAAVKRLKKAKAPAEVVAAAEAARYAGDPLRVTRYAGASAESMGRDRGVEGRAQMALLVDIHGNPLWPVALDPRWRTEVVVGIAREAYDNRLLPGGELEAARLGVLADALEEAGCTDRDILTHLRSPGPHVRGCWPVDLVLDLA
jgi:hypothetical protein